MNALMGRIFASLDLEQQLAICELEKAGLVWGTHFGHSSAVQRLAEMRAAWDEGRLYEWLRDACGVVTE